MSNEDILEAIKHYPEIIDLPVRMDDANEAIKIFEGEFTLKNDAGEYKVTGRIYFDWVPNSGADFVGTTSLDNTAVLNMSESNSFKIIIDGLEFGQGFITNTKFGDSENDAQIKGTLSGQAVLGDKSVSVEKLRFAIPNLRDFIGLPVKKIGERNISTSMSRLRLENEGFTILLDKCNDYNELHKKLETKGGFINLYAGELINNKSSLSIEESKDTLHCLNTFITFLNGRRTSALFIHGIHKNETLWIDYSGYHVDSYKAVTSWPQKHSITGLNELWRKFSEIWKDKEDRNFLTTAIHWYVEANSNAGFAEGSIIMAQTALELLYNWWIVENKKLIIGKDSENISASNKIRLLLSQLNITHEIPSSLTDLQAFVDGANDINDAPEAVVQIRNAIVHSQEEKRRRLTAIPLMAKYQALQLCLWYIETSLLCILSFEDRYFNRCSKGIYASEAEMSVPWAKKK
jgi:hypothetical protein